MLRKFFFAEKEKNAILLVFHLRRLVFDQSSPVHRVSEYREGGTVSVTNGEGGR